MRVLTFILLSWLPFFASAAIVDVPTLQQRVTDNAGVLNQQARQQISDQIVALEQKTGHQLAVLTVNTTGDDTIEQFATRVFDSWKLGDKQRDDGVLLVMAKADHTVRIEVGYGLEGELTDLQASQIINDRIIAGFKRGDFAGGLLAGTQGIASLLGAPVLAPSAVPEPAAAPSRDNSINIASGKFGGWLLAMIVLPFFFRGRHPMVKGLYISTIVTAAALVIGLLEGQGQGVDGGMIGLVFFTSFMLQVCVFGMFGNWGDDSGSGGRSSGGSSSGGGFSGGGGSSGGGGASGRW